MFPPKDSGLDSAELTADAMFPRDVSVTHLSILKKKWKYRGEGNANLVLALPQERVILRLHKTRRDTPLTEELEYEEMNRVCQEAFFCRTVMVPLLGKAYIQPPSVAHVQHKEIHQLDQLLLPERPNFRHHKGISFGYVNIYPDYALLPERLTQTAAVPPSPHSATSAPTNCQPYQLSLSRDLSADQPIMTLLRQEYANKNCVISDSYDDVCKMSENRNLHKSCVFKKYVEPTFCVEIKPKQGWIPNSQAHHRKCTFCLNQYLKLSNGAINRISQYCPLDLFSGDEKRMKKAIKALLSTPQNNLKIFKDGYLVYSDEMCEDLGEILQEWLDPSSSNSNEISTRHIESFCSLVHAALTSNLLGHEEHPPLDDEFCPLIYSPPGPGCDTGVALRPCDPSSRSLPTNCILDRILLIQKLQQYDTETIHHMLWKQNGCDDYDYVMRLKDPDSGELRLDPLQSYLLATTAKDCSILIAFQRLRNQSGVPAEHIAVAGSGTPFVFNIGVSDLDPKPVSCVEKHRKRDADILYACSQHQLS